MEGSASLRPRLTLVFVQLFKGFHSVLFLKLFSAPPWPMAILLDWARPACIRLVRLPMYDAPYLTDLDLPYEDYQFKAAALKNVTSAFVVI